MRREEKRSEEKMREEKEGEMVQNASWLFKWKEKWKVNIVQLSEATERNEEVPTAEEIMEFKVLDPRFWQLDSIYGFNTRLKISFKHGNEMNQRSYIYISRVSDQCFLFLVYSKSHACNVMVMK